MPEHTSTRLQITQRHARAARPGLHHVVHLLKTEADTGEQIKAYQHQWGPKSADTLGAHMRATPSATRVSASHLGAQSMAIKSRAPRQHAASPAQSALDLLLVRSATLLSHSVRRHGVRLRDPYCSAFLEMLPCVPAVPYRSPNGALCPQGLGCPMPYYRKLLPTSPGVRVPHALLPQALAHQSRRLEAP